MKQKTKFKQTEMGKIPNDWRIKELKAQLKESERLDKEIKQNLKSIGWEI